MQTCHSSWPRALRWCSPSSENIPSKSICFTVPHKKKEKSFKGTHQERERMQVYKREKINLCPYLCPCNKLFRVINFIMSIVNTRLTVGSLHPGVENSGSRLSSHCATPIYLVAQPKALNSTSALSLTLPILPVTKPASFQPKCLWSVSNDLYIYYTSLGKGFKAVYGLELQGLICFFLSEDIKRNGK